VIGSLRGVVLDRARRRDSAAEVLLEVGGVGYRVIVPSGALGVLGEPGTAAFLHVHTHVREDAIVLYGFPTRDERQCFEVLIGAHGVGPAVALAMLSVHGPVALRRIVSAEDTDALALVPGIGPKTARRLVIELKSRLEPDDDLPALVVAGRAVDGRAVDPSASVRQDLRAALAGLGYAAEEIRESLAGLPPEGTVEDLLRLALKDLAGAR
jgi:Holliday junction DNA helicase RuvA